MTDPKHTPDAPAIPEAAAAALAAGLLVEACGTADSLQLRTVRDLARQLAQEFESLRHRSATPETLAGIAALAADLASLAACNTPHVPARHTAKAAAATHLASGAARALGARFTSSERISPQDEYRGREARGVGWRARLAARQVDEALAPSDDD